LQSAPSATVPAAKHLPATPSLVAWCGATVLGAALLALPSAAGAASTDVATPPWVEVRSVHFVVASNASESEARGVAEKFEQIRSLFHSTFPELQVDPAQPIVILAARDETTMKMLAPDEWGGEGHIRPAGVFHSDGDKDYVLLRLDAQGTTAFHTIYHEYTHALLHLNFTRIPLWLNEGLAEFFGNSTLGQREARTGTVDEAHLYILRKNDWLPIETLLDVNERSPYYNEKNPASVFYSESWAMVHYLLLDPEARHKQLLKQFLLDWNLSGEQVAAGRQAFGDLRRFEETIKKYVRQADWHVGVVLPGQAGSGGDFSLRTLPPAEVLALRGDFFAHRKISDPARPLLVEAVALGPEIAATHAALGFYEFRAGDFAAADEQMSKAIELGSTDFMAFYCHGVLLLKDFSETPETTAKARAVLEIAEHLNPRYAPTFEALTQAYSRTAETQGKALQAAETAVKLEPGSRTYRTNLAYVLLNNGRTMEARAVADKLAATSSSPEDTRTARSILSAIEEEEEWERESSAEEALERSGGNRPRGTVVTDPDATMQHPAISRRRLGPPEWMAVEGSVGSTDCARSPELRMTLNLDRGPMDFHAADFGRVSTSGVSAEAVPGLDSCKQWNGRRVKVWFRLAQGKEYLGEIIRIYFY
jgi:tetratricopeptide (TPR) repeat protein